MAIIIQAIYSILRLTGIWGRLLNEHTIREARNVENKIDTLSNDNLDRRVSIDITRKE
jgi:hypothetical protein